MHDVASFYCTMDKAPIVIVVIFVIVVVVLYFASDKSESGAKGSEATSLPVMIGSNSDGSACVENVPLALQKAFLAFARRTGMSLKTANGSCSANGFAKPCDVKPLHPMLETTITGSLGVNASDVRSMLNSAKVYIHGSQTCQRAFGV
jgi:hypothetical protein